LGRGGNGENCLSPDVGVKRVQKNNTVADGGNGMPYPKGRRIITEKLGREEFHKRPGVIYKVPELIRGAMIKTAGGMHRCNTMGGKAGKARRFLRCTHLGEKT